MARACRTHHPLTPIGFLAPALTVLGVFTLGGAAQVLVYSFTRSTAFAPPTFVGIENYRRLLASDQFWWCVGNSALYTLITPVLTAVSLAAALVVRSAVRGMGWLRLALFLPVVTPTIVAAVAWRALLREDGGLLNATLALLDLGPIPWLSQRPWTLISPMLVTLWKGFGFYMMIFLAGLAAVPRELEEAAAIDGAGRLATLRAVILPTLAPSIVLVSIISSISALKVFDELFVTVRGVPIQHQTGVPLVYDYLTRGDYGMASAAGMVLFAFILALSVLQLRITRATRAGAPT